MTPDPILSSIATAVAGKAAELAVQGGKEACAALIKLIRERFSQDRAAAAALEAAQGKPAQDAAVADLARALERLTSEDAVFAAQVHQLWPRARAELSASDGGIVNSATGSVGGHLMQARDVRVEGGLHFGDVQPPEGS
jgi:HEAT repeat protein